MKYNWIRIIGKGSIDYRFNVTHQMLLIDQGRYTSEGTLTDVSKMEG